MRSKQSEKYSNHLHTGNILQYQPYQEPRYVSHYTTTQTLKPVITPNPYQPSLVKHQQYFTTLEDQSEIHNKEEIHLPYNYSSQTSDRVDMYARINSGDPFYNIDHQEERIYQSVQDPVSQI